MSTLLDYPEARRRRAQCTRPLAVLLLLTAQAAVCARRAGGTEVYQDFRGGRPLLPSLKFVGPDVDAVTRSEDEGLRITLPATRPVNHPVEVATTFALSGDFEITGTYELLSADRPSKGYGVGVSLNIADNDGRTKFAKVARVLRAQEGSVFQTEYWTRQPPKDYQVRTKPTESRLGQLRLARKGSALRYLAADMLGGEFSEVFSQENFGTEDMAHVHFVVADSGTPGNAIDARLVDLRIRSGGLIPDQAADPASSSDDKRPSRSKGWLAAGLILGLVITVFLCFLLWFLARRRRRTGKMTSEAPVQDPPAKHEAAAASVSFPCPGCAKNLKAKATLAGKDLKCPHCGQSVLVPALPPAEL